MNTLKITSPSGDIVAELAPAPRSSLKQLKDLLIRIQSAWINSGFSVGEACLNDEVWGLMEQAIALLPIVDCNAGRLNNLNPIESDYPQIERIFFAQKCGVMEEGEPVKVFSYYDFVGCDICWLHRLNPDDILREASTYGKNEGQPEPEPEPEPACPI